MYRILVCALLHQTLLVLGYAPALHPGFLPNVPEPYLNHPYNPFNARVYRPDGPYGAANPRAYVPRIPYEPRTPFDHRVPLDPRAPLDLHTPFDPRAPFDPHTPFDPRAPFDPHTPFNPRAPFDPHTPFDPRAPFDPHTPFNPRAPFDPHTPFDPRAPLDPRAPFDPRSPFAPLPPRVQNPFYPARVNAEPGEDIPIVSFSNLPSRGDGEYAYSFVTADGKEAHESGFLKDAFVDEKGEPQGIQVAQGSYSYIAPDGSPIQVTYVADENGFQPSAIHIPSIGAPQPPPPLAAPAPPLAGPAAPLMPFADPQNLTRERLNHYKPAPYYRDPGYHYNNPHRYRKGDSRENRKLSWNGKDSTTNKDKSKSSAKL